MARILVVDDEEMICKLLKEFLEEKGYQVATARDGKEALAKIGEAPEIVLLDIMMRDMDGMEVLDRIKETSPSIDVIMVTGLVKNHVGLESMRRGAFDFVTKPIDLKHLEELIRFRITQRSLDKES